MGAAAALASRTAMGNNAVASNLPNGFAGILKGRESQKTLVRNGKIVDPNAPAVQADPEMPEITGAMTGGTMRNNPNVINTPEATPAIQDVAGMSGHDLRQKYAELITGGTAGTGSNRSLLKAYAARIKELSSGPNGGGAFGAFTGFDKVKDPHSFLKNQDSYSVDENVNSMNDSADMIDAGGFSPQAQATATGVFGSQTQRDMAAGASTSQRMLASLSRTQS